MSLAGILRRIRIFIGRYFPGKTKQCELCGRRLRAFVPYRINDRNRSPLMRELQVVGSDVQNYECPWCSCTDRERHLWMYMNATGLVEDLEGKSMLHFAPEQRLSLMFGAVGLQRYVKADLVPHSPDVIPLDMQNTGFEDEAFDYVMANHVLEHVDDLERSLSEVFRILAPGGRAILQTPYSEVLERTWSDPGIRSPEARFIAFGQEDHVRVFGRDIVEKVTSMGFEPDIRLHRDVLASRDPSIHGVNAAEPLFLFRKPIF